MARAGGVAQVAEDLPRTHEGLNSNPSMTKKKQLSNGQIMSKEINNNNLLHAINIHESTTT
jgi:hypothetical protein